MADSQPIGTEEKANVPNGASPQKKNRTIKLVQRKSMWDDPIAKVLAVVLAVVILGGLLTGVFALVNGTIDLSGAPTSTKDRELILASQKMNEEEATGDTWQEYIVALVSTGNMDEAKKQLGKAKKANLDVSRGENLLFLDAVIAQAEGNTEKATELYNEVVEKTYESYKKELETGGTTMNWAMSYGVHQNYDSSLLALASIYTADKDWENALTVMDKYLTKNPREAGMLIDRGKVKVELGDYEGARADFQAALQYMPGDAEITKELEKIEGK